MTVRELVERISLEWGLIADNTIVAMKEFFTVLFFQINWMDAELPYVLCAIGTYVFLVWRIWLGSRNQLNENGDIPEGIAFGIAFISVVILLGLAAITF